MGDAGRLTTLQMGARHAQQRHHWFWQPRPLFLEMCPLPTIELALSNPWPKAAAPTRTSPRGPRVLDVFVFCFPPPPHAPFLFFAFYDGLHDWATLFWECRNKKGKGPCLGEIKDDASEPDGEACRREKPTLPRIDAEAPPVGHCKWNHPKGVLGASMLAWGSVAVCSPNQSGHQKILVGTLQPEGKPMEHRVCFTGSDRCLGQYLVEACAKCSLAPRTWQQVKRCQLKPQKS